ncbi:septum formation initiator family protein [Parapedobacter sp. ISTM3]|uniref:Cell division protein FtsB n=1 Tax=Parapedobacter luteus TaxID=623280 RepID=A0A1T5E5T5_9SPHI|nr:MULTISPECIES: septum formation initiator family protein [Parapedobacter]MBK1441099.1 septum formation initiator family protein [Parapedobacter sp. ISTM3]SKB79251.1 Cell division protein FtsB [Parapedobacter luteus]
MERLLSIIRNKYLLAAAAFMVWMLFFDRHDVTTQYDYYSQLKGLKAEKAFYTAEIERVAKTIHDLNTDPQALQRIAREKYKMKKENEDVFVIVEEEE